MSLHNVDKQTASASNYHEVMGDSNNSPAQKINYFKVGEYLQAIRYVTIF